MNGDAAFTLAALRERGAHAADPVHFRYVEALARRTAAHSGEARRLLDGALARALADFSARHDAARADAGLELAQRIAQFPAAADTLRQHHEAGDFRALRGLAARLEMQAGSGALAELVRALDGDLGHEMPGPAPAELKTLTQFRRTWAQLGVGRQLSRSLAQVPENPGPLNSHLLALRALQLMQETSPAYLERFMSQVEALLWLNDAAFAAAPAQAQPQARSPGREGEREGEREGKLKVRRKPARGPSASAKRPP